MRSRTETSTLALLAASCLVLAVVDHLIPKPVPFFRIGLANLPILIAVRSYRYPRLIVLAALKALGRGLLTGTLLSYVFLFSAAGTIAAVTAMFVVDRLLRRGVSLVGMSVAGAFASNGVQLALSAVLVFGRGAILIAPLLLLSGTVTSILLGLFANRFVAESIWYRQTFGGRGGTVLAGAEG